MSIYLDSEGRFFPIKGRMLVVFPQHVPHGASLTILVITDQNQFGRFKYRLPPGMFSVSCCNQSRFVKISLIVLYCDLKRSFVMGKLNVMKLRYVAKIIYYFEDVTNVYLKSCIYYVAFYV